MKRRFTAEQIIGFLKEAEAGQVRGSQHGSLVSDGFGLGSPAAQDRVWLACAEAAVAVEDIPHAPGNGPPAARISS